MAAVASAGRLKRRLFAGSVAVLLVVAVALAVVAGILAVRVHAAEQEQARRQAVLHAARQEAIYLTSLNYKTINSDIGRIMQGSTGEVKKMFAGKKKLMHKLVGKSKAVTDGKVLSSGIVGEDQDSAQVLVVADSTVKNKQSSKGTVRHYRLWMTLVHKDGQWLVSKLDFNKPKG